MNTATVSPATPKVNDILVCSWGYDQTNVDFYKVLKLSPSGKSVTIVRINSEVKEDGFMCGKSVPAVPHTVSAYRGEHMTKRIKFYDNSYCVNISNYSTAFPWDGTPERCSWYA
jgi:hypothetical protein